LLTNLQIVTRDQWKQAFVGVGSVSQFLDRLQKMPAWWNSQFPVITPYQREQIENALKRGFRTLDRELRVNDYLILDRLGEGGMAVVYKAWSIDLRQVVAVKLLLSNDLQLRERQQREARIMRNLAHPCIARFLGFDPIDNGDGYLLVMEYLEGVTLKSYVADHGPVPVPLAVDWLVALLDALQHAHGMGILHRDIHSKNIMVQAKTPGKPPTVALLDFGLGKLQSRDDFHTADGALIGTPQFMSPEHFRSSNQVTAASDVYSLACNAYVMLTGSPPFKGTQLAELCLKHLNESPPPLSDFRSDIPPPVQQAIQSMLRKRPAERGKIPDLIEQLKGRSPPAPVGSPAADADDRAAAVSPKTPKPAVPHPAVIGATEAKGGFPTQTLVAASGGLIHPEPARMRRVVGVSALALRSRFIDPIPTAADATHFALRVAHRTFWFAVLAASTAFILSLIWKP
jgi:serine/threonine protein kinase